MNLTRLISEELYRHFEFQTGEHHSMTVLEEKYNTFKIFKYALYATDVMF